MSSRLVLFRSALAATCVAALVAFALVATEPAAAVVCVPVPDVECPCFDDLPPAAVCFQSPPINSFAYIPPPANLFAQVTQSWCRLNGVFMWISPIERMECEEEINDSCVGDADSETDAPC